jgi:hypothetical protein
VNPKAIPEMLVKRKFPSTSKEFEPQPSSWQPVTLLGKLHIHYYSSRIHIFTVLKTLVTHECQSTGSFIPLGYYSQIVTTDIFLL